ncbi:hypothetical protein NUW58_g6405 [Xylaria curta]|uniref:Uncharacterized protein n=1 Tax=Xylaria curta TaxID=42375 RepID=A0ACC1NW17_9PEZI|nr:hypothetical protein NUW58_g6405 [Xylaria curta]
MRSADRPRIIFAIGEEEYYGPRYLGPSSLVPLLTARVPRVRRYHEILFMIDTCQANTMYSKLYSPNIIATGSSELDQSSYSHHADNDVGVAVIDRYTYYNLEFLESEVRDLSSKKTVGDLFDSYTYEKIHSNAGVRAKNATVDDEMLALSRTIARLRAMADQQDLEANNDDDNNNTATSTDAKPQPQKRTPAGQVAHRR